MIRVGFWLRVVVFGVCGLLGAIGCFIVYANLLAERAGQGVLFDEVEEVPMTPVALVLGTSSSGGRNPYFHHRVEAAARLWHAGKVRVILVSGDNSEKYYNEPLSMRVALMEKGVPAGRIVMDFAGFRTYDSVVRAKEVFRAPAVVLVSQRFQNERAAFIARAVGLRHCGYNARQPRGAGYVGQYIREIGARVKMWLDLRVLGTKPKFLGPEEELPL